MSVRVKVRMSKIMCTPIKVGVRTYATYANRRTLEKKEAMVIECYKLKMGPSLLWSLLQMAV